MVKCPACGYQYGHTYNHSNEIARLKSLRSKKSREYIKFTIDTKRTYIKLYGKEKARDKLSKMAFETSNGKDAKNYFIQESIFYSNKKSPMRFVESNRRRKRERDRILDEISKSVRQFISDKLLLREIENKKDE